MTRKIKNALISVYHKDNLDKIVIELNKLGVTLYSTGGTYKFIEDLNIPVTAVEDLTSYPSILGGRVKTLHPKVFGGILARRDNEEDIKQLKEFDINEIDLVLVDLYPFEDTVASGAPEQDIIEKIDIGGISLIRAAAKNFKDVLIVSNMNQYNKLYDLICEQNGETSLEQRKEFAKEAFNTSSHYDIAIFNYFAKEEKDTFKIDFSNKEELRYGENPHQKAAFYGDFDKCFEKISGKVISYNNLLDIDAAANLIDEFNETTFAILKHNNACGIASRPKIIEAWKEALSGDPVSAFGGILVTNAEIDLETAIEIDKLFYEVVIAPNYKNEALELLKKKGKRIILKDIRTTKNNIQYRTLLNGLLVQDVDSSIEDKKLMKVATSAKPTEKQFEDLEFALKVVKHSKSNAIVLAKDKKLLASGVGQTSRVDALKQAIEKANSFENFIDGGVMASDAFFPFADSVEIAYNAGVKAVVQPGGSVKDKDSIEYCNNNNMSMVFTGVRHFKH
ncbi:MAG: bifunctional phosphoribosylaminoimidazolecarboxamide formyltransferase/IMP cyclohydrolase [Salinivirgaceae bacterium]|nr:bifunctional phosphoribosylaminoimidazolecarboxamide formyltransferase/IMP cyclohydrolase [Salinivirgaceae bacterium]